MSYEGTGDRITVPMGNGGFIGLARDGCLAESYRVVFGEIGTGISLEFLPSSLRDDLVDLAYASPVVGTALEDWVQCVASRGYEFENPLHVYRVAEARFDPEADGYDGARAASAFEVEVTNLMKECDAESNLYEAGWADAASLVTRLASERTAEVAAYRNAIDTARTLLS